MAKNKVIVIDKDTGRRFWITKKGKLFETNWRKQSSDYATQAKKDEIQKQLYRRK